jgi:two-component system phosphate regulon sensor histidine kinase PhoR
MRLDRLFVRLFAAFAAVVVLILATAAWLGDVKIREFHREEVERRLETAADLLAGPSGDALESRGDPAFAERIRELGQATELRLTVIRVSGEVIADSGAALPVTSHVDRPEIVHALSEGRGVDERRSTTTGVPTHYLARRVERDGRVLGVVRAAAELQDMERALAALHRGLVVGGLIALGFGLVASLLLARRVARPLERMAAKAASFAEGDLDRRVAPSGPHETRELARALNTMAERLAARIRGERAARAELEAILASMAEGVVAVDADERVLLMNGAAARLLGLVVPVPAGTALWQAVRFPSLERELRAALTDGTERQVDAPDPAGTGRTLALSVAPVALGAPADEEVQALQPRDGDAGRVRAGAVVLLSDVSTVRRLDQMRADFVANVSHELRTPLSAVIGALETLAEPGQDAATTAHFVDLAARNAARLKAIVNDLLDLSTLEAQSDSLPLEPVSVLEPLRSAAAALAGAAQKKGVQLEVPPATRADGWVQGHPQRLEQCFTNLLANAIQYTPAGGRVSARVRTAGAEVHVEVTDTGIGIPEAALVRVFERFYRVDRGRGRETGGTGLGLAIVKHIVLAHGGQVEVKSEEGRGSTFTVRLPRGRNAPA